MPSFIELVGFGMRTLLALPSNRARPTEKLLRPWKVPEHLTMTKHDLFNQPLHPLVTFQLHQKWNTRQDRQDQKKLAQKTRQGVGRIGTARKAARRWSNVR
jgi:hypothetical protein